MVIESIQNEAKKLNRLQINMNRVSVTYRIK